MTAVLIVTWTCAACTPWETRDPVESVLGYMFSAPAIIATYPDDGRRVLKWRCE